MSFLIRIVLVFIFVQTMIFLWPYLYYQSAAIGAQNFPAWDLSITWDHSIPFIPEFIYVYISLTYLGYGAYFFVPLASVLAGMFSTIIMTAFNCLFFIFIPAPFFYKRDLSLIDPTKDYYQHFKFLYETDIVANTFPSLHVAYAFLPYFILKNYIGKYHYLILAWVIAISLSVVFTRQHFIIDIPAGFLVALFIYQYVYLNLLKLFTKIANNWRKSQA